MSRNGSGVYNLPAGNPVVTGTTISSTWANNTLSDIATALTGSIATDGQTAASANLPMGGYAHTNVGNATLRNMYAAAGQVQDGSLTYLTSVSGTNAITAVAPVTMGAYATGQVLQFVSDGANTGAVTININSIGIKSVTKNGTDPLVEDDIPAGAAVQIIYDGTQFQLINPVSAGVSLGADNNWTGTQTFSGTSTKFGASLANASEDFYTVAAAPSSSQDIYVNDGCVQYFTTSAANNWTPNFAFSSGTSLNSALPTDKSMTITILTTQGATAYFSDAIQIDGSSVSVNWQGGTAPTAGNPSGIDVYRYAILKTASATFTVLASLTQY